MKAGVLAGTRAIRIEDRPDPLPGAADVVVRIKASGICGSDVHGFEGLIPDRRKPGLIVGHEAAGEVVAVGRQAQGGWAVGDRVAIDPQISCGRCHACARGWFHLCDNRLNLGSSMNEFKDGTMCELIALPARQLHRLPEEVSYNEAAMVEPASVAVHVFNRVRLEPGCTIVIMGTGTIGLIAVQVARLMGAARLIAVDRSAERLQLAGRFGADLIVDATKQDPVKVILSETRGRGADAVVEAVGLSGTYDSCIRSVRKRGSILAVGYLDESVPIAMRPLIFREISLIGCTGFTFESDAVLELMSQGKIDVKPLITHRFPLADIQRAFETASDAACGSIKVMVLP